MHRIFIFLIFLVSSTSTGYADATGECGQDQDLDRRIIGCSKLIASGSLKGDYLAAAHGARGWAYRKKGQCELAIVDLTVSYKIHKEAMVLINRALCFETLGLKARAYYDYKRARSLSSRTILAEEGMERLQDSVSGEMVKKAQERFFQIDPLALE